MHKIYFWLSAALGVFFGLTGAIVLFFVDKTSTYLALPAGILFAFLLYAFLCVYMGRVERKYRALESQIPPPILHKIDSNLHTKGKVLAVRLCFCSDRLVILCAEHKPAMTKTVLYSEIASLNTSSPYKTIITTSSGEEIDLQTVSSDFLSVLRNQVGLPI